MSYGSGIRHEARFVNNMGPAVVEDKLHAVYNGILKRCFPTTKGFSIEAQVNIEGDVGRPDFVVVRKQGVTGLFRNTLLVVELKRPQHWSPRGREDIMDQLTGYMEGCIQVDRTQHDTIYGLAGIGFHWVVCMLGTAGPPGPSQIVVDW